MAKRKRISRSKAPSGKARLVDMSKRYNMSMSAIHHEIKKIINKIVDRCKQTYFEASLGVFDIVIDLSEKLGVKNNPAEIFKKLDARNRRLCINEAIKKAPHLAKMIQKNSEDVDLLE